MTAWPYDTCESSCFRTEAVAGATGALVLAATDLPTWTVDLGGEYFVSNVRVLLPEDKSEAGFTTAERLSPSDVSVSDELAGPYASIGAFTIDATKAAFKAIQPFADNTDPVRASFLRLTANKIDNSGSSTADTAEMAFCGIQVYG